MFSLINYLDNNYWIAKEKLGFGPYSFKLELIDSSVKLLYSSSINFVDTEFELKYDRTVFFKDEVCVLRGVIALEK